MKICAQDLTGCWGRLNSQSPQKVLLVYHNTASGHMGSVFYICADLHTLQEARTACKCPSQCLKRQVAIAGWNACMYASDICVRNSLNTANLESLRYCLLQQDSATASP